MSSAKPRVVGNIHVFVACQTEVVNKQLSWNKPLSETSLSESYTLTIYKHVDAKEKHSLDVEGIYNVQFHVENKLL